jgi:hypothetical protein
MRSNMDKQTNIAAKRKAAELARPQHGYVPTAGRSGFSVLLLRQPSVHGAARLRQLCQREERSRHGPNRALPLLRVPNKTLARETTPPA